MTTRYVSIELEFERYSKEAMLFFLEATRSAIWIPNSQIRNLDALTSADLKYKDKTVVEIPEWLAIRKELDDYCDEIDEEVR